MTNIKSPANRLDALKLLRAHAFFADLPEALFAPLLSPRGRQEVAGGELLFREGDRAGHCLLVQHGCVELFRFTADGEERVFQLFGSGQLVGDAAMFMAHGRYPMNARAQSTTVAYRLSRTALRSACEQYPPLAMRLLESLGQRLYRQVNEVDWLTSSSAAQRLAAYLLNLQRSQGAAIGLPINQRQLAAHLGIRAESLSRLFSEWQQRGLVRGRQRAWELCDLGYLQQLAQGATRSF
ncbi:Crp/Fnr family transcriptional regulator [Pseudomonas sp. sp1636]|uniref:Crp/Fnr family transcriptional regulator n=1 Tax=Pseudomonas sp. sp1636 TaxID=3036707 RepID=UPI0025A60503|nr:Crp/Fnr family transcriptional regulator [Pseudomonas sp. sp1636]MDM8348661.1 Crp/Fnr family transcriptional regulator [Pseudomonas sp. sp1636]